MTLPKYTTGAEEVRKRFEKKLLYCYVESHADKLFWRQYIKLITDKINIRMEQAHDSSQIDIIAGYILDGNDTSMVIRDSDYLDFSRKKFKHPRIIYTFGHSLENSLYNSKAIAKAVRHLSITDSNMRKGAERWLKEVGDKIKPLLILEIANEIFSKGVSVLGNSSVDYLDDNKSCELSDLKIRMKYEEIARSFSDEEIEEATSRYVRYKKRKYLIVRGHFLTFIVTNFINRRVDECKSEGKKSRLNPNALYSFLSLSVSRETTDESEYSYMKGKLGEILAELRVA